MFHEKVKDSEQFIVLGKMLSQTSRLISLSHVSIQMLHKILTQSPENQQRMWKITNFVKMQVPAECCEKIANEYLRI